MMLWSYYVYNTKFWLHFYRRLKVFLFNNYFNLVLYFTKYLFYLQHSYTQRQLYMACANTRLSYADTMFAIAGVNARRVMSGTTATKNLKYRLFCLFNCIYLLFVVGM
jgi:hypothetical protein